MTVIGVNRQNITVAFPTIHIYDENTCMCAIITCTQTPPNQRYSFFGDFVSTNMKFAASSLNCASLPVLTYNWVSGPYSLPSIVIVDGTPVSNTPNMDYYGKVTSNAINVSYYGMYSYKIRATLANGEYCEYLMPLEVTNSPCVPAIVSSMIFTPALTTITAPH
jgi:hypothetical protein